MAYTNNLRKIAFFFEKIWSIQKNVVPLHPLSKNESWMESLGAPENFNFWGEREHGKNSHERCNRESY